MAGTKDLDRQNVAIAGKGVAAKLSMNMKINKKEYE